MLLTVVDPGRLADALPDALAGGSCVAPAADAATIAMLRPEVPLEVPDTALVVATSGSTGRPKGVLLSRSALLASADATHDRLGGPGVWHCALPPSYVAGAMTLVRAHAAGTRPVFVASDLRDVGTVAGRNYLSLVPTQLHRALADADLARRLAAFDGILLGGAALDDALRARAEEAGLRLVTTYGASETCGGCVYDGLPLDGVEVGLSAALRVRSSEESREERGTSAAASGRIELGGPTIFSGYRCDPEATANALMDGRFVTSDRGEWVAGRLRVLGRLDDVVITGGVNVDLAAAQRAADGVLGVPEVGGIVLVGVSDPDWGTRIVAVTTSALTASEIRSRLGAALGRAALPHEVRRVDSLPRTGGGKIDRQGIIGDWR